MEEERPKKYYKIQVGDKIKVQRTDIEKNGKTYTFYKTGISKKNYKDNTFIYTTKPLSFKTGTDIPNDSIILIKDFFEDFRENPADKHNAIWSLFILDYDIISEGTIDSINEYKQETEEANEKPINPDDIFANYENGYDDNDLLPF